MDFFKFRYYSNKINTQILFHVSKEMLPEIIVCLIIFAVVAIVISLIVHAKYKNYKKNIKRSVYKSKSRHIPFKSKKTSFTVSKIKRAISVQYKLNAPLYSQCSNSNECSVDQTCSLARMFYVQNYDIKSIETNDLIDQKMIPFPIRIIENNDWSITDVVEFQDNLIISTDTNNIVIQSINDIQRIVPSNIKPIDMVIYQDQLLALGSDKTIYSMHFHNFYDNTWLFSAKPEYGKNITSLESSKDRRGIYVSTDVSSKMFIDGKFYSEESPTSRILGNEPDQYADFDQNSATIFPNNVTLENAATGIFTDENRFFKLDENNNKWIQRLRLIQNQPLAISQRVCVPKNNNFQEINIV